MSWGMQDAGARKEGKAVSDDMLQVAELHGRLKTRQTTVTQLLGEVGPWVLVGNLPVDLENKWSFRTRVQMFPNPSALKQAGLSMAMIYWPLKRKGVTGLVSSTVRVGRSPSNDVVIPLSGVSKLHARLMVEAKKVVLADEGSANGTFVNGVRLTEKGTADLQNGSRVAFGAVELNLLGTEHLLQMLTSKEEK